MLKLLSIIVPVYNEEHLITKSLPEICRLNINKEVIVIDDGSQDKTPFLLQELKKTYNFKLITQAINQGKGAAVKKGLQEIKGDYFIVCDADLEYEPQDIASLFTQAEKAGHEKIAFFGSRFKNNKSFTFHYLVNRFLTELTNLLFKIRLTDMETCFKMLPVSALSKIKLSGKRFEIEPEITTGLIKAGYKIKEIPISYTRRSYQEGKKITAKDGFLAVITIFKTRFTK